MNLEEVKQQLKSLSQQQRQLETEIRKLTKDYDIRCVNCVHYQSYSEHCLTKYCQAASSTMEFWPVCNFSPIDSWKEQHNN